MVKFQAGSSTRLAFIIAVILSLAPAVSGAGNGTLAEIFQRPIMTRVWQYEHYALSASDGPDDASDRRSQRLDIAAVAAAIAGMKPSYVSSIVRLRYDVDLTDAMISDFTTIRSAVLAVSPNAKFDVELNMNPNTAKLRRWPDVSAITTKMAAIDSKLPVDGWWLDYYSGAARKKPEWLAAVSAYAQAKGQTVGGNIGGGRDGESWIIPEGADAVAFADAPSDTTGYGYGIDAAKLRATSAAIAAAAGSNSTALLGHLHCNPQDGFSSEPCVFMREWNATRRAAYVAQYWPQQQRELGGFTIMWPVFFPLCPGNFAYDATHDVVPQGSLGDGLPARADETVLVWCGSGDDFVYESNYDLNYAFNYESNHDYGYDIAITITVCFTDGGWWEQSGCAGIAGCIASGLGAGHVAGCALGLSRQSAASIVSLVMAQHAALLTAAHGAWRQSSLTGESNLLSSVLRMTPTVSLVALAALSALLAQRRSLQQQEQQGRHQQQQQASRDLEALRWLILSVWMLFNSTIYTAVVIWLLYSDFWGKPSLSAGGIWLVIPLAFSLNLPALCFDFLQLSPRAKPRAERQQEPGESELEEKTQDHDHLPFCIQGAHPQCCSGCDDC
ncbi:hypothetical protein Micbo1qcDRAFT_180205 [Microdochium bolleyi]|uniref:Uncharacterized protein n=1 Tax=Microdochium bolleyi TaxID=196109 RepID=A0A136INI9_9PEZI|nr:hypothetical protein Micbo1qcDRAFT_180205 [Microdochium bolleyi]